MTLRVLVLAASFAFAGLLSGATAQAEPGPIQLVSKTATEQADRAEQPALSADGDYVAFAATLSGLRGIFRADLRSGEIIPVVASDAYSGRFEDAAEPSISADGRYVSFTTTRQLQPPQDPGEESSDVYVADMSTTPPTYEIASARDGCDPRTSETPCGLSYPAGSGGSIASGRVSLSADGRELAFTTTAPSDLGGAPESASAGQVAVRNLATDETTLIGVARNAETGAIEAGVPVPGGAALDRIGIQPGAAISGDGSTVAWNGVHLAAQVALSPSEAESIQRFEGGLEQEGYEEPLWRRIPTMAEPVPPTRRIIGGEPFPGIIAGANNSAGRECGRFYGWETGRSSNGIHVPALSANGGAVALIGEPDAIPNVFLVDMGEAVPRVVAVRQLTREVPLPDNKACDGNEPSKIPGDADIKEVAISPAGDRIAFTTSRQQFPLSPPNLVGPRLLGLGAPELYVIDLGDSTLQRLTHGTTPSEPSLVESGQTPSNQGGALSVSFDGTGETLAFSSSASNLVPGDGNREFGGSDVFTVTDLRSQSAPGSVSVSSGPPALRTRPRRRLTASSRSLRSGSVRVAVAVPSGGHLRAKATAKVVLGRPPRTVAEAKKRPRGARVVVMTLHPRPGFARQVRARGGLEAKLAVYFSGPGGPPLKDLLEIHFRRRSAPAHPREGEK